MKASADKDWFYPVIELWVLPIVYSLIAIISLILVLVGDEIRWYQPILPALLALQYKGRSRAYAEAAVNAVMYRYATPEAARDLRPHADPEETARMISRIASQNQGSWKVTHIEEMYERPRSLVVWLIFLLLRVILLIQLVTVVIWSFSARITVYQVLGILLASYVIGFVLKFVRVQVLLNLAMDRWVGNFLASLKANRGLEKHLMDTYSLDPPDVSPWLRIEVAKLVQAGINPDLIQLEAVVNPESNSASGRL
jgi:hypothetical protein